MFYKNEKEKYFSFLADNYGKNNYILYFHVTPEMYIIVLVLLIYIEV